jgi:hypothetical protein
VVTKAILQEIAPNNKSDDDDDALAGIMLKEDGDCFMAGTGCNLHMYEILLDSGSQVNFSNSPCPAYFSFRNIEDLNIFFLCILLRLLSFMALNAFFLY